MNKEEFIHSLTVALREKNIQDVDDIVSEYEQHFANKLANGYSEEEIAARLGDPKALADQFGESTVKPAHKRSKPLAVIGLVFADIILAMLYVLLLAWVVVLGTASIAFAAVGVGLMLNISISGILPYIPYLVRIMFAIGLFALAVLAALGTVYCWLYVRQLLRCYCRWHKNVLASASGEGVLPQLPAYPQIHAVTRRYMRRVTLTALTVFAITFILGYIIAASDAGSLEFWHVWEWFV